MMNTKDKKHLAIAKQAIRKEISWLEASRMMKTTRVHQRICSLLRKEHKELIEHDI